MNNTQQEYLQNPARYRQLVWDYELPATDFFAILNGQKQQKWLDQTWALSRVLEHAPYYDVIKLVPLSLLVQKWPQVKKKLFNQSIKNGYEYLVHKYTVSTAR